MPGRSGTRKIVTFASDVSWVTPEMMACFHALAPLLDTQVPGSHVNAERTWTGTP